jgi:hypothetical protein
MVGGPDEVGVDPDELERYGKLVSGHGVDLMQHGIPRLQAVGLLGSKVPKGGIYELDQLKVQHDLAFEGAYKNLQECIGGLGVLGQGVGLLAMSYRTTDTAAAGRINGSMIDRLLSGQPPKPKPKPPTKPSPDPEIRLGRLRAEDRTPAPSPVVMNPDGSVTATVTVPGTGSPPTGGTTKTAKTEKITTAPENELTPDVGPSFRPTGSRRVRSPVYDDEVRPEKIREELEGKITTVSSAQAWEILQRNG